VTLASPAERASASTAPCLADYGGASLPGLIPALLDHPPGERPTWLPEPVAQAERVVLLVLDGLGNEQLEDRLALAPNMAKMTHRVGTSVVPTTTATALTSLTTGLTPAEHGVLGYRIAVGGRRVLNVLRWRTGGIDARGPVPPTSIQPATSFGGRAIPVVIRGDLIRSGFSSAHLAGCRPVGYRLQSSLAVEVRRLTLAGESFVYAYYDGVDKVAHEFGLEEHYEAELAAVDRMVGDLIAMLPAGTALLITSDHGQVLVADQVHPIPPVMTSMCRLMSGEGRFRWLHAQPGAEADLLAAAQRAFGHLAWVMSRQEIVDQGWFGGRLSPRLEARLGDVALVAREPVAFLDPDDTGEVTLQCRHGSVTSAEMLVPLLGVRS
jgi:hypothetical protein